MTKTTKIEQYKELIEQTNKQASFLITAIDLLNYENFHNKFLNVKSRKLIKYNPEEITSETEFEELKNSLIRSTTVQHRETVARLEARIDLAEDDEAL